MRTKTAAGAVVGAQASRGMGLASWLLILFVALKLTGYIGWSWLWVLSPLWIPWVIILGFLIVIGVLWLLATGVLALIDRRERKRAAEFRRRLRP